MAPHPQTGLGGLLCLPAGGRRLVLGEALTAPEHAAARDFLVHRALAVLKLNASVLTRAAPIDLWPIVAAYLKLWSPSWTPQGIDQGKLGDWLTRFQRAGAPEPTPRQSALATEVIATLGSRSSTLGTVLYGWGNRIGLLATGSMEVALTGIAWATAHGALPAAGRDRMTWIGRNAEARDLMVFAVSDACTEARRRRGLAG